MGRNSEENSQFRLLRRFSELRGLDYVECLAVFQGLSVENRAKYMLEVSRWFREKNGEAKNLSKKVKKGKLQLVEEPSYTIAPKRAIRVEG